MRLSEELLVLAPVLGLVALLPLFYWRKVLRCRWVSIFGINLTKEWHKPNKTQAAHGRCQGRTEVIRMFQKDERSSFPIQPLDDLDHKLTVCCSNVPSAITLTSFSAVDGRCHGWQCSTMLDTVVVHRCLLGNASVHGSAICVKSTMGQRERLEDRSRRRTLTQNVTLFLTANNDDRVSDSFFPIQQISVCTI